MVMVLVVAAVVIVVVSECIGFSRGFVMAVTVVVFLF